MKVGIQPADDYTFFYGNGNAIYHLRTGFFIHKAVITAVMRVEFISDRMPYKTLRDFWCDIIVPNVHAPTDDKMMIGRIAFMRDWNPYSTTSRRKI
jgi:hypothetical protein